MRTLFLFKEKQHRHENSFLYILFLMRIDLVIKLFHILSLTALNINLSVVAPIVIFVQLFGAGLIEHGI